MNNYRAIFKKALGDAPIEGISCICPSAKPILTDILRELSPEAYVSEWRYGMGEISYRYHIHKNGIGPKLKDAFQNNIRGGHPKLTAVYSAKELQEIIQKY